MEKGLEGGVCFGSTSQLIMKKGKWEDNIDPAVLKNIKRNKKGHQLNTLGRNGVISFGDSKQVKLSGDGGEPTSETFQDRFPSVTKAFNKQKEL